MNTLSGQLVRLRPLELSDAERCTRWLQQQETTRFILGGRMPFSRGREEQWLASMAQSQTDAVFAICTQDGGEPIGTCGLHGIEWVDRFAVAGIAIFEEAHLGRGVGTEAMRLLVDHAFWALNLERVELNVFDFNTRAIHVYKKLGFVEEGRLRRRRFKEGRWVDEILMAVSRVDWRTPT